MKFAIQRRFRGGIDNNGWAGFGNLTNSKSLFSRIERYRSVKATIDWLNDRAVLYHVEMERCIEQHGDNVENVYTYYVVLPDADAVLLRLENEWMQPLGEAECNA